MSAPDALEQAYVAMAAIWDCMEDHLCRCDAGRAACPQCQVFWPARHAAAQVVERLELAHGLRCPECGAPTAELARQQEARDKADFECVVASHLASLGKAGSAAGFVA